MTELQLGLIACGAVAVFGVIAYNRWQERRHRRLVEEVLASEHDDVLLGHQEGAPYVLGEDDIPPMPVSTRFSDIPEPAAAPQKPAWLEPSLGEPSLAEERLEPVIGGHVPEPFVAEPALHAEIPEAPSFLKQADSAEPALAAASVAQTTRSAPAARAEPATPARPEMPLPALPANWLANGIDYIVTLEMVEAATPQQLLGAERETLLHVSKRLVWLGFDEQAGAAGQWQRLDETSSGEYRKLRVGVQLADRRGPVADGELTAFEMAMQRIADEFMAYVEIPPHQAALDAARDLDGFCVGVDIQVGVTVQATGPLFPGTKVRALAEAAGMTLEPEGVFALRDDEGRLLFTLGNATNAPFTADNLRSQPVHGLTFLLDVPRVPQGDRQFGAMAEQARRFADSLDGVLVDDNRRPLNDALLATIRRQIGDLQARMSTRGITAGSVQALRLFS